MGSIGKTIADVITFIPNTIASVLGGGSSDQAPSQVQTLTAPEPEPVTPMVAQESREADIKAAEDEASKKKKAAAAGRSSLVSALTLPTALGTGGAQGTGAGVGVGQ